MKKRIEYIDAMRGFSILIVVYSHILSYGYYPNFMVDNFTYNDFFILLVMPLFFFVSGFVFYKIKEDWSISNTRAFLQKKFVAIIIPAILFLLLYTYVFNLNLISVLLDNAKGGYWFTIVLFEYFIIYILTNRVLKSIKCNNKYTDIIIIISSLLLLIFSMPTVSAKYLRLDIDILNLFCVNNWKYYVYFIMGVMVKKRFTKCLELIDKTVISALIYTLFILISIYFIHNGLFDNGLYNHLFLLVLGILGVMVVFMFFRKNESHLSKNTRLGKMLQFIGKRTLDIYLLHYFFLPRNMTFLSDFFIEYNLPLIEFIISFSLAIVVTAISLLVSQFIRTSSFLAHYLFGVKLENSEVKELEKRSKG